jgi:hypothetical protein
MPRTFLDEQDQLDNAGQKFQKVLGAMMDELGWDLQAPCATTANVKATDATFESVRPSHMIRDTEHHSVDVDSVKRGFQEIPLHREIEFFLGREAGKAVFLCSQHPLQPGIMAEHYLAIICKMPLTRKIAKLVVGLTKIWGLIVTKIFIRCSPLPAG